MPHDTSTTQALGPRVLTEKEVREIRASTDSQNSLAKRYKLAAAIIRDVCERTTWTHLEALPGDFSERKAVPPPPVPSPTPEAVGRFWSHVDKNGPVPDLAIYGDIGACWPWTVSCGGQGYGNSHDGHKVVTAHRLAFRIEHGRAPAGNVLHRCDRRACVNPAHLYEGTIADNSRDMMERGRGRGRGQGVSGEEWQATHPPHTRRYKLPPRVTGDEWHRIHPPETWGRCIPPVLKGEEANGVKLTADIVREIRASDATALQLATKYGVTRANIYMIRLGKTWKHL